MSDALLVTKFVGSAGAASLVRRFPKRFRDRFSSGFLSRIFDAEAELSAEEACVILEALPGTSGVTRLGAGGFYQGLWDYLHSTGNGCFIDLNRVPIHQETVELANFLQEDPYTLYSAGCVLAATERPEEAVERLRTAGIPAAIIGEVRRAPEKTVLRDGEPTFLRRPERDILERMG